jgi:hypothetical protein
MHQNLLRNLFAVFLFAGAAWAQVTVLPVTLPLAEQGAPYNVAFSASGGLAPYTFSVIQGNLPAGLTLSSAGVLSGTPTQAGTFGIVVQAVASGGTGSGDRSYTLFVVDASCPDPNAFVGVTYGSLFSSEPSPSFYSPAGGTFPPGLDVNADGFVSGTPTTAGSFTFGVNLDFGSAGVFVKTCTIHVNSQLGSMAPFSVARLGVPYRSGVTAYGGTAPFSFALQSGSLPPGLALNSSNGQITGTPTGAGLSTFTVLISDNNGRTFNPTYTINVLSRPEPAASLRCPAPTGVGGFSYLSQVSINSGSVQSFAITQGQLPPGVTLDSATGIISGPLTLGVNASFRVSANLGSSTAFADCNITTDLQFPEASPAGLCADQYDFQLGEAVHFRVPSTGSRRPISTQLYQTQLPPGFTLDPATGIITGTPTSVGSTLTAFRFVDNSGFSSTTPLCGFFTNSPPLNFITENVPNGVAGQVYNIQLQASGGLPPYEFFVSTMGPPATSGGLPPGLTLTPGGLLSGTPTTPGTYPFLVVLQDSLFQTTFRSFSITVFAPDPLRFSGLPLPPGTVNVAYNSGFGVLGGAPPYSVEILSGSVPGLSVVQGSLRGTPTVAGNFPITVRVSDTAGSTIQTNFTVIIGQGSFRIGCPAFSAELGAPYSSQATVFGGTAPLRFAIQSGALPAGLTLNATSGEVSGRPSQSGASVFTIGVTDAAQQSTAAQCSIGVIGGALRILTSGPINTQAGTTYAGAIEAAGGRPPYRFGVLGNPAPGLNLAENGNLSGTASRVGDFAVQIQATDAAGQTAQRTITFRNSSSSLSLACPSPAELLAGVPVQSTAVLSGGVGPYTLALSSGVLPPGVSLGAPNANGIAALSGAPSANGTFVANLTAGDATGTSLTQSCSLTVTGSLLTITTQELPSGQAGSAYAGQIETAGGTPPQRYSIAGGSLPPGVVLNASNGALEGLPRQAGAFNAVFEVRDRNGQVARRNLEIEIAPGVLPLTITTLEPLPDAVVGRSYQLLFSAEGGSPPYTISTEGDVPLGLTLGRGIIGTPREAGEGLVLVTARDSAGGLATKTYRLRVVIDPALFILTDVLPDGVLDSAYRATLAAQGGTPPYRWNLLAGRLPAGVSFDSQSGGLLGTPTENGQFDAFVLVEDSTGEISAKGYRFEVRPAGVERLEISTATLPNASLGIAYNARLEARGGQAPYRFAVRGPLPEGLTVSDSGEITGVPTRVTRLPFEVVVNDTLGLTATRQLFIEVGATQAPGITLTGLPEALGPNANAPFGLNVTSPLAIPVSGRFTLTFAPDAVHGADDPAVRFGNGQRTLDFVVPAASGPVTLPSGAAVQTGTLAGVITIATGLDLGGTTQRGPMQTINIRRAAPVITAVRLTRSGSGLEVRIEGFTNTRQLAEARINFSFANNVDVTGSNQATVNVAAAIQNWFASAASAPFGGRFALTIPFTVSGDPANVTGVSVVITNAEGTSNSVTAQ